MFTLKEILATTGMSERMQNAILSGELGFEVKADGEIGQRATGLINFIDEFQLRLAVKIAGNWDKNRIDVGMKYPDFSWSSFQKKFKARIIQRNHHLEGNHPEIKYTLVKTRIGIFSFGRFPKPKEVTYSYTGAVLNGEEAVWEFVEWLLKNPRNYIKDLEIGMNGLGGYNKNQLDKIKGLWEN